MDKEKIEHLLTLGPSFPSDDYRDSIVSILTPPTWYYPVKRHRFYQQLDARVALVMAEYAGDLVNALTGGKTQTVTRTETQAANTGAQGARTDQ